MKINFSKIVIKDINWDAVDFGDNPLHRSIAGVVYNHSPSIDLGEIAKNINLGKEVELRTEEVKAVKDLINSDKFPYTGVVKREVIAYIDSIKK